MNSQPDGALKEGSQPSGFRSNAAGNLAGSISLLCNLPFLLIMFLHPNGCYIGGAIEGAIILLGIGFFFALAAGFMGSRRWFWASLLPAVSFVVGVAYSFHVAGIGPCW
jgi:hypothetical protein